MGRERHSIKSTDSDTGILILEFDTVRSRSEKWG
jgi:hypothetical protein